MSDESASERLRLTCVEATERLADALAVAGFKESLSRKAMWVGPIAFGAASADEDQLCTVLELTVPAEYPFEPPLVRPLPRDAAEAWACKPLTGYYEVSEAWHLERSGRMCLYEPADHLDLPWADPPSLLRHVARWLYADHAGWPDDPPALDLDRYFTPSGQVFLFDLPRLRDRVGEVVSLTRRHATIRHGSPVLPPKGRKRRPVTRGKNDALVLDLGTLREPVRNLDQVKDAAGDATPLIEQELKRGIRELVILYNRGGEQGVLALTLTGNPSPQVEAHLAAPTDVDAVALRSHPRRKELADRRVAIVGVGAIGSVLADLLHRSGVGKLHLIDPDLVLPGNLVRHLCGDDHIGRPKAEAVRAALHSSRPGSTTLITVDLHRLRTLAATLELFEDADVVADASADSTATRLVRAAADAGAGRAVSVAVLADGYAVRVDRYPTPASGPMATADLPPRTPGVYEAGCSSPVSTTPPAAVWEAASVAARHVIAMLLSEPGSAGEERVLRARKDTTA